MLAQKNEFINEASATIYQLSQEETVRLQCEAREDYYRRQRSVQSMIEEQKEQLAEYENTIHEYKDTIQKQADTISELKETITKQEQQLTSQEQQLTSLLTWASENGYRK